MHGKPGKELTGRRSAPGGQKLFLVASLLLVAMPGTPSSFLLLIARMLLVVMPFVITSDALVTSSFLLPVARPEPPSSVLLLVAMPFVPSSVLAPGVFRAFYFFGSFCLETYFCSSLLPFFWEDYEAL